MKKTESKAENKMDFVGGYKSKDKIKRRKRRKRRKRMFLRRTHHDNKMTTKMIKIQTIKYKL